MGDAVLTEAERKRLSAADLTYAEVGATAGELPAGYTSVRRQTLLGTGDATFDSSAEALLGWQMHRRAGVQVAASAPVAAPDVVAVLRVGLGRLRLAAPVRVVHVVDEPARRGFAYGTLPGHPATGEEAFLVERDARGRVTLTITAFSRPATRLARIGAPVSRLVQRGITTRYLRALR